MEKSKMNDDEYEYYVLGAALNDKFAETQILEELYSDDFYNFQHRRIFDAFKLVKSSGRNVELASTARTLKDMGHLEEAGGVEYLTYIRDISNSVDIDYYIVQIKNLSSKRKLLAISHDMASRAVSPEFKSDELIDKYSKEIASIGVYTRDKFENMENIVNDYKDGKDFLTVFEEEQNRVARGEDLFDGVRSYYSGLDNLIGGFANGSNTIIGARSSSGKTTFLTNLFLNIHEHNPNIRMGFFSLEMRKSRIMEKLICIMSGVSFKDLQERRVTPIDYEKVVKAEQNIKKMKLSIFDRSGININEFKSHIRRESIRKGLDIVFLDYLSIIQAFYKSGNKHQEIDQISKGIQSIALELNIPMVSLSQLNRAIYGRTEKTPVLSDLRESGSIEEDADNVLMLHRPAHYDETKIDVTQLIVAKNRLRGDLGKIEYSYDAGRYHELQKLHEIRPSNVVSCSEKQEKKEWVPPSSY